MDNHEISRHFSLLSKLMDIHNENSFKSKTYSVAAYKIDQLTVDLQTISQEKIFSINGIGEAIGKKVIELIQTGHMQALNDLLAKTPEGILEMMKIKGIGPKKIALIWKEMGIENVGELLYACHENRLSLLQGFGKKTQDNVIESIEFFLAQQGSYLYAQIEQLAFDIEQLLQEIFNTEAIRLTGAVARQDETAEELEYIIPFAKKKVGDTLKGLPAFVFIESSEEFFLYKYDDGIKVKLHLAGKEGPRKTFERNGSPEFVKAFYDKFPHIDFNCAASDEEIFKRAGLPFIPLYLRENETAIDLALRNKLVEVIQPGDIKGIIHCHSNWSDGSNTLEELAKACMSKGFEYLVMSDHSKSAFYAQGLSEQKVYEQHQLIDELNLKFAPFKIYKSIESDILSDGRLDYSDSILSTFDMVIASVHANLKMSEDKATTRLIKAIENRYTTILGHMTGRLLLSRKGYPVDYKKVIDSCAANNVVIEINAHPRRLDMRWQWLEYALSKNVLVSIDPDAHSIAEFSNTRYGVLAAQKGMVSSKVNLSSFTRKELDRYLSTVR